MQKCKIKWKHRQSDDSLDEAFYFEPYGFKWSYFLYPKVSGEVELVLIDDYGYCDESNTKVYKDLATAKKAVKTFYHKILDQHLTEKVVYKEN